MPIDYTASALPKGKTRKQVKAARDRHEAAVEKRVRELCVARDGACRVNCRLLEGIEAMMQPHGTPEWAHMHEARRSKTRGQAPEARHATQTSLMLCTRHHDAYDGRTRPRLVIEALTDQGADGPMKFTYKGRSYSEA